MSLLVAMRVALNFRKNSKPSKARQADALESPRCSECNGHVRPEVVWFGEMLPVSPRLSTGQASFRDMFGQRGAAVHFNHVELGVSSKQPTSFLNDD
ncbi:Sir2 family NAD-dependent protein deacetylase [Pseudomonas sp. NGC7]|uniref:Sir2 family NAD-dependent protein deacetylase n=1 Tax=Pseudomonas sp. NGC7 TaxID=3341775 RepID=UPI00399D450F